MEQKVTLSALLLVLVTSSSLTLSDAKLEWDMCPREWWGKWTVGVDSVALNPYPVRRGQSATFNISAFARHDISHGKLEIWITKWYFWPWVIIHDIIDLCSIMSVSCPVKKGADFTLTLTLPFGKSLDPKITVLTGAGISAESGIPTFRGAGGLWRTWSAMELATPEAFAADPSLVWEFYHYRRCVVANAAPNMGHYALSMLQKQCEMEGKNFTLVTQNIDGLHWKAGSKDIVELHGSLWKTRCCRCNDVEENYENPICPALDGKGAPNPDVRDAQIPVPELPHCKKCNALLRPHVIWFGERLDPAVLDQAEHALIKCDLLLVVGTSAVVQPAAGFAPIVQGGGGVVAEFNLEDTPISRACRFKFHGSSAKTLPQALGICPEDLPPT